MGIQLYRYNHNMSIPNYAWLSDMRLFFGDTIIAIESSDSEMVYEASTKTLLLPNKEAENEALLKKQIWQLLSKYQ